MMEGNLQECEHLRQQPASQLIECVLAAAHLSKQSNLEHVVQKAVFIACPPALAPMLVKRLRSNVVYKKDTINRGRLALDAALALHSRTIFAPPDLSPPPLLFVWADSSPQGGRDWLLAHAHVLKSDTRQEHLKLLRAVGRLVQLSQPEIQILPSLVEDLQLTSPSICPDNGVDFCTSFAPEQCDCTEEEQEERARLTRQVTSAFTCHQFLPGALGAGAASLPHKASTLLSRLQHETGSAASLQRLCCRIVSVTTDMGTELGLPDVPAAEFWSHFHESCGPGEVLDDAGEFDFRMRKPHARARISSAELCPCLARCTFLTTQLQTCTRKLLNIGQPLRASCKPCVAYSMILQRWSILCRSACVSKAWRQWKHGFKDHSLY